MPRAVVAMRRDYGERPLMRITDTALHPITSRQCFRNCVTISSDNSDSTTTTTTTTTQNSNTYRVAANQMGPLISIPNMNLVVCVFGLVWFAFVNVKLKLCVGRLNKCYTSFYSTTATEYQIPHRSPWVKSALRIKSPPLKFQNGVCRLLV